MTLTWHTSSQLDKPTSQGKRVIAASRSRLERLGLISVERTKGKPVTVAAERKWQWEDYSRPGARGPMQGRYTNIPKELWTNGWHSALDGKALAGSPRDTASVWIAGRRCVMA